MRTRPLGVWMFLTCLACGPPDHPPSFKFALQPENLLRGDADWRITRPALHHELEGYGSRLSLNPGEILDVAVSSSTSATFTWQLFRLGYYGGLGARKMTEGGPSQVDLQADCPADRVTGLVDCAWTPTFSLPTQADWPAGIYLVKMERGDGFQRYIPFVLSAGQTPSEIVVVLPTATWSAYNDWGGESLYRDSTGKIPGGHATKVSLNRPFENGLGAGDLMRWDRHLIRWLESQNLSVRYVTTQMIDANPSVFQDAKAVLTSGHDEYWSSNVRKRVDQAVAGGASLLVFGANTGYWQIRFEAFGPNESRIVTCYKSRTRDPLGPDSLLTTVQFRDPPLNNPENKLFGVMYVEGWNSYAAPLVVSTPSHWVFDGTGLNKGDVIPGAHGYEVDQIFNNGATPKGVTVVAKSPVISLTGERTSGEMVIREDSRSLVFASGGTDFVQTLGADSAPWDEQSGQVESGNHLDDHGDFASGRIAANVLYRALDRPVPDPFKHLPFSPSSAFTLHPIRRLVGQSGEVDDRDGQNGRARMNSPISVAVLPHGELVVGDMGTQKLKLIKANGVVQTLSERGVDLPVALAANSLGQIFVADLNISRIVRFDQSKGIVRRTLIAGGSARGMLDGPGLQSRFNWPTGLALSLDEKSLYVADSLNGCIRKVSLDDPENSVSTVACDLHSPSAVATGTDGRLYALESGRFRVVEIVRGKAVAIAGAEFPGFSDGNPLTARFRAQFGLAVLKDGSLAVSDTGNYRIRRITPSGVSTVAGTGKFGDGPLNNRGDIAMPTGMAVGPDGTLFVAESGRGAVLSIRSPEKAP